MSEKCLACDCDERFSFGVRVSDYDSGFLSNFGCPIIQKYSDKSYHLEYGRSTVQIKYCPWCGRKLVNE